MSKITLTNLVDLTNETTAVSAINANNQTIVNAFNDTLSLDGTAPNSMSSSLDMNSNQILNLPAPATSNSPLRLQDLATFNSGGTLATFPSGGTSGQVLAKNSNTSYDVTWENSVTSVGLTMPSDFTVTGSPVTSTGTLDAAWTNTPTGSGGFVRETSPSISSPTLTTPSLGVATATSINGITIPNIPLSAVANQNAYTLTGNFTASAAAPQASSLSSLTQKVTPASTDLVLIQDQAASGQLKYAEISAIGSSSGVASIESNTGAFTLSHGLTNSTNDLRFNVPVLQGYLVGCTISTAGSSSTFSVTSGVAVDNTQTDFMQLSALSKTTSAWAVGTGSGALDTGAIAASTWYHVYVIKRTDTGVVDILISASISAPTMPTNYTLKRRIGSIRTDGSSNWLAFTQIGDRFLWSTTILDANNVAMSTASRTLQSLTVPPSVQVIAEFTVSVSGTSNIVIFTSPYQSDQAAGATGGGVTLRTTAAGDQASGYLQVMTNTSNQIGVRAFAAGNLYITTSGWVDRRGRD